MPVGNPKPQSVATRKYEQKTGYVSKSYKLWSGHTTYQNDEGIY